MGNFLIGCDVGTSGAKSVLIDDEGKVYANEYIEYPLITPRPGWAEQDPEWYWNAVADTIKVCINKSGVETSEIRGVSISALSPACIMVDKDLKPLQMAHIWMDRRGTRQAEWIKQNFGARATEKSGNPVDPYYATVKLLWEKENRKELYKKAYRVLCAANYPTMKLTGVPVLDYSNASLFGVGFDIVGRKWDYEMLEKLGLNPDIFPDCYPCDEVIGEVTAEAAERTGLKKGTPVVAGTADGPAAYVAGGAIEPGDMSLAMGTAGCMGLVHNEPMFTKDMVTVVHTSNSKTSYTTNACIVSCGALTRYFRDNFAQVEMCTQKALGLDAFELMNAQAAEVPPGSDGLITLPYFMGERTPMWDPYARGVLFGMSLAHTRGHMIRSFLEGAAYALYQNYRLIRDSGCYMKGSLVVGEGGAKSPLWRQIISDVFDIPVSFMKESKGAPVGNAINAGVGTGVFKDYSVAKKWVDFSDNHAPDPEKHKTYVKYFEVFERLYPKLKDEYIALSEVTGYK